RGVPESQPAGRLTPRMGIVQTIPESSVLVQRLGPGTERHVGDFEIRGQRVPCLSNELAVEGVPEPLLPGDGVEVDRPVLEPGRRPGRRRRLCWCRPATATRGGLRV